MPYSINSMVTRCPCTALGWDADLRRDGSQGELLYTLLVRCARGSIVHLKKYNTDLWLLSRKTHL